MNYVKCTWKVEHYASIRNLILDKKKAFTIEGTKMVNF